MANLVICITDCLPWHHLQFPEVTLGKKWCTILFNNIAKLAHTCRAGCDLRVLHSIWTIHFMSWWDASWISWNLKSYCLECLHKMLITCGVPVEKGKFAFWGRIGLHKRYPSWWKCGVQCEKMEVPFQKKDHSELGIMILQIHICRSKEFRRKNLPPALTSIEMPC